MHSAGVTRNQSIGPLHRPTSTDPLNATAMMYPLADPSMSWATRVAPGWPRIDALPLLRPVDGSEMGGQGSLDTHALTPTAMSANWMKQERVSTGG